MGDLFHNLIFCLAFLVAFAMPHMPGRRMMLLVNVFACSLFACYYWGMEAYTGMAAVLIAGVSSAIQACIPYHRLDETFWVRFGISLVMAGISIVACYQNAGDLLPLIAVIGVRLSEAQKCQQRMRYGYVPAEVLWIIYGVIQGLPILILGSLLFLFSLSFSLWRHEAERKKTVLVRVEGA